MRRIELPESLVEHARSFSDGTSTPAEPRHAATVILLRPTSGQGPELYLLRRQTSMAFAGGMCVFPGGGVDRRDFDATVAWAGPSPAEWAATLGVDEKTARALVCAAVRETFEESGVLLAGASETSVVEDTSGDDWEADRLALEARELAFTEFLSRRGLVLRTDLLGAWSAWQTPVFEPKRYRTWFFVAALPTGQRTRDVSTESSSVMWRSPARAMAEVDAGEIGMMPPTYLTCLELSPFTGPDEVLAACDGRDMEVFTPAVTAEGDAYVLSVPARFDSLLAR